MTYARAKQDAQTQANAHGLTLTLYFSPIERSDFEPEAESWGYAPIGAVEAGYMGRWRDKARDETVRPVK